MPAVAAGVYSSRHARPDLHHAGSVGSRTSVRDWDAGFAPTKIRIPVIESIVPTLPKDIGVFCKLCKLYRGKPVPLIVTSVPPVTGPLVGLMLVICGPAYVKRSTGLTTLAAPFVSATTSTDDAEFVGGL
jgi:hypothetical protein